MASCTRLHVGPLSAGALAALGLLAACANAPPDSPSEIAIQLLDGTECRADDPPCVIDFDGVEIGGLAVRAVDVVNLGDVDIEIGTAEVLGNPSFALQQAPSTLRAGESYPLAISFRPSSTTTPTAALYLTWGSPAQRIQVDLHGQGTLGGIAFTPAECDFGDVIVGETSPPCVVSLLNPGTVEVAVEGVAVFPPFATQTDLIVPLFVQPGTLVAIPIVARPTTTGQVTGTFGIAVGGNVTAGSLSVNGI